MLTVAEIGRWNAGAVRNVFHAAKDRAEATLEVSRQLASLTVFANAGGKTAEAASHQNTVIRQDLDAHGYEALAVARAADRAADGIVNVQSKLASLRAEAAAADLEVDAASNRVLAIPRLRYTAEQWVNLQQKCAALQAGLNEIVAEANAVDEELALAVNMADGDMPIPANVGPPVGPEGLTSTQRVSDANEELLREERIRLQAHIGQLQVQFDQSVLQGSRDFNEGILDVDALSKLEVLTDQLTAAKDRLGELDSIEAALGGTPETYLTQLRIPDDPLKQVFAAVAVGNPDTAANVSVTVPGVGSTTRATLSGMVAEARELRAEEQNQLSKAGKPVSVAAIAWLGYTPPPNPLDTGNVRDLWLTMTDDEAQVGAADLSKYLQQVRANNPTSHLTVLGHSYGSLTASLALQDLNAEGAHPVNDAVFYGSPGLELYSPDQLGLDHGHAYVMQAPHDLITDLVAPLALVHGWGMDPYLTPGLTELSSQAGLDSSGIWRDGVSGHADYPRTFLDSSGRQQLKMSGYNLAAVAAGLPGNTVMPSLMPPILSDLLPGVLGGSH